MSTLINVQMVFRSVAALVPVLALTATTFAQPPAPGRPRTRPPVTSVPDLVTRIMAFDSNKDGQVTRAELTDDRLLALFVRADANSDGTVTQDEWTALFTRENEVLTSGQHPANPPAAEEAMRAPADSFGPARAGLILTDSQRASLKLSELQTRQILELQRLVDDRLSRILTDEQKTQLAAPSTSTSTTQN